jgi:flagellin
MSVINTNITSMIGQQNLNESKNALTTSMERLSSGLRINSAKDDAAGQAIANRMSAQITGLSTAQRNANDGISVAQTAEGGLNQVNDNLQRIRELAVQAENGTNSQDDLNSIQNEIGQRLNEINRISEQTDFNGTKVLQDDGALSIQVGANDGETISINLKEINAETLGLSGFNVDGQGSIDNRAASVDDLTLQGFSKADTANADGSFTYTNTETVENTAASISDVLGAASTGSTVTYTGTNNGTGTAAVNDEYTFNADTGNFSFDADDVTAGNTATYLTDGMADGERRSATVTVADTSQEIEYDDDGNIFAADDGARMYTDSVGNLTKNNGGTVVEATLGNVTTNIDSNAGTATDVTAAFTATDDNVDSNVDMGVGGSVTYTQGGAAEDTAVFTFDDIAAGTEIAIGGVTLTAQQNMTGDEVAAAFADNYDGAAGAIDVDADDGSFNIAGTADSAYDVGTAIGSDLTFTATAAATNTADLAISTQSATGSITTEDGASIVANATGTGGGFNVYNGQISAENVNNNLDLAGGEVDIGDGKVYNVSAGGDVEAGVTESSEVTFGALSDGDTLTVSDGTNTLRLTATGADLTAEQVAESFNTYITDADADALGDGTAMMTDDTGGQASFLANFTSEDPDGGNTLTLTSENANQDVANISLGGTAVDTASVETTEGVALNTAYADASGDGFTLDSSSEVTTSYYAQENGAITNETGSTVYADQEGELTLDAATASERTEDPLAALDSALNQVDSLRSDLGAIQNRFESAITNLSTNETNLSSARSRIEDADYATEVANMTKNQILQQAGTSVLAQANQLPQSVLSLLG